MNNYNDDVFQFDNDSNEEFEKTNSFNYDSISGLGESNYENEDLFNTEIDYSKDLNSFKSDDSNNDGLNNEENDYDHSDFGNSYDDYSENYIDGIVPNLSDNLSTEQSSVSEDSKEDINLDNESDLSIKTEEEKDDDFNIEDNVPNFDSMPIEEDDDSKSSAGDVKSEEIDNVVEDSKEEPKSEIQLSNTPIEELNKLTEYKEDVIESADISNLFDKVSVNFKDASEVFKKNTDLKKKIDSRFDELKKLQSEIENSRKVQLDEIDKYKEEVYSKLTEKKEEIEKRLNLLKETQTKLEKEKNEFEQYKKKELENIDRVQKEVQSAYDDRREELSHIEDVLRKQKDALDEERNQLSLDRIQYESDKNELANNLLKFNDLVNSFTNGVDDIKE